MEVIFFGKIFIPNVIIRKERFNSLSCPQTLENIFKNQPLDEIVNPRILKIREKALMYKFQVVAIPGKKS